MKVNKWVAEIFGTFALVFVDCGAIIANDSYGGALGHMGICAAFGLVVMTMIYVVGNISGAHFNPAVTIGFVVAGRLDKKVILPYVTSQMIGTLSASVVLRLLFPAHPTLGATLPSVPLLQAFIIEVILSFFLMFVILNVTTGHMEKGIMAGAAIGGTVAMEALMGGPLTGASMNPARSLGPALLSGQLDSLWIYLIAPVVGTTLAYFTCKLIQGAECCPEGVCEDACECDQQGVCIS